MPILKNPYNMTQSEKYQSSMKFLADCDALGCRTISKELFIQMVQQVFGVEPCATKNSMYAFNYLELNVNNPNIPKIKDLKIEWFGRPKSKYGHVVACGCVTISSKGSGTSWFKDRIQYIKNRGFIPVTNNTR